MNAYAEALSQDIWNFQCPEQAAGNASSTFTSQIISQHANDIPRVATLLGMKYLLRATVTDCPEDRNIATKQLDKAKKLCKSISGKDKIEALANTIAKLNAQVAEHRSQGKLSPASPTPNDSVSASTPNGTHIDLTTSKLYVNTESDDMPVPAEESLFDKFQERPAPVTDPEVIARNLELDIGATLAAVHLWNAIVLFMSRNFLSGGLSLRKSWKKYNSLYKEIQKDGSVVERDVVDSVEAGVGAFLYSVSVIPSGVLKSVLKVIGFREDQDLGISLVWDVLFRQGSEIPMVFLVLSANYLFLASELDLETSLSKFRPVLEYCLARYNTGLTFSFVANVFTKKTGHIHAAISHLENGIKHCDQLREQDMDNIVPSSFYIDLSQAYLYLYKYKEAQDILNKAMAAPFDFTKKGLVALHLAVCELRLGKEENLDHLLKEMAKYAKLHKQETYTNTKAKLLSLCKTPDSRNLLLSIAAYEMMYYRREIPTMKAERKEASIEKFKQEIGDIEAIEIADLKMAALVIYGCFISSLNQEAATKCFRTAVNMKKQVKYEKQWIAFANFELANVEFQAEKYDAALGHLKQVNQIKTFPFDDVLKTRAKALEKQVRVGLLESGAQQRVRARTV